MQYRELNSEDYPTTAKMGKKNSQRNNEKMRDLKIQQARKSKMNSW